MNGAESCLTALDTYWDTSIIAKPSMRIKTKGEGPTPDTTILNISDGETPLNPTIHRMNYIRMSNVQIQFFATNRTDNDKYIKAILKALTQSDYAIGCGYYWNLPSVSTRGISGRVSSQFYDTLMLAIKNEFISSW
jgi:hypothetical protein